MRCDMGPWRAAPGDHRWHCGDRISHWGDTGWAQGAQEDKCQEQFADSNGLPLPRRTYLGAQTAPSTPELSARAASAISCQQHRHTAQLVAQHRESRRGVSTHTQPGKASTCTCSAAGHTDTPGNGPAAAGKCLRQNPPFVSVQPGPHKGFGERTAGSSVFSSLSKTSDAFCSQKSRPCCQSSSAKDGPG